MVAVYYELSSGTNLLRYFHRDHLGSISAITDESGAVVEQLAYDTWGKRRFTTGQDDPNETITSLANRGYTGHEHLEEVGLIHMNGRIYDPLLARFMSADPTVQDPLNGQSWNRYAYVLNNPLAYTDPNGFFFKSLFRAITNFIKHPKYIIAIVAAVYVPELGIAGNAFWNGVIGGAAAGGIAGGNVKSVVTGGISGGIFAEVGTIAQDAKWAADSVENVALHVAAGGITSVIQGGDFKSGFLAVGFTQFAGPQIPNLGKVGNGVSRAIIGGAAAVVGGGKFENGAVTAAFAYAIGEIPRLIGQNKRIVINGTDADKEEFKKARNYLSSGYSKAEDLFAQADKEGFMVNIIRDGNDRALLGKRIVFWDPYSALTTPDGLNQSPALGLYHEMVHAFGDPTLVIHWMGGGYDNTEEYRVIHFYETPAAKALGEGVRYNHRGTPYSVLCSICR